MNGSGRDNQGHDFGYGALSRCKRCGSVRARKGYGWTYSDTMQGPWLTEPGECREPPAKNPWRSREIVFFDVETTGLDWRASVVTEVGFVRGKLDDDGGVEILDRLQSLVQVPSELLAQAEETSKITGITLEMLNDAPAPVVAIMRIQEFLRRAPDDALVASFNTAFDVPFLGSMFLRCARALPALLLNEKVLDPLIWSRKIDKFVKGGHKLTTVAMRKGLIDENDLEHAHRADFDAELGLRVLAHFANLVPQDLDELWLWQRAARGESEMSLFNYLLKKAKEPQADS